MKASFDPLTCCQFHHLIRVRRARWDLAAMKLCILIVTRKRIAVEIYKWWRCRSPLNLHVDGGVCDCPTPWKLFVTVVTQNSLALSPLLKESQQQGQTGSNTVSQYELSNDKQQKTWALLWSRSPRPHNVLGFIFSVSFSFAKAVLVFNCFLC